MLLPGPPYPDPCRLVRQVNEFEQLQEIEKAEPAALRALRNVTRATTWGDMTSSRRRVPLWQYKHYCQNSASAFLPDGGLRFVRTGNVAAETQRAQRKKAAEEKQLLPGWEQTGDPQNRRLNARLRPLPARPRSTTVK